MSKKKKKEVKKVKGFPHRNFLPVRPNVAKDIFGKKTDFKKYEQE